MVPVPAQGLSAPEGVHLVLYDGVCGLCNRLLQFLFTHDRRAVFCYASLQSATGRETVARWGGDPDDLDSFHVVANFRTPNARALTKSDAALFVIRELPWPWRALRIVAFLPLAVRNRLYNAIARSRYRIFGRFEQCVIPS